MEGDCSSLMGIERQIGNSGSADKAGVPRGAVALAGVAADRFGRALMPSTDRKLRIAVAVFEPGDTLGPAIETLLDEGIPLGSLGLVVGREAANRMAASGPPDRGERHPLSRLIEGLAPLSAGPDAEVMASPALVKPWYLGLRAPGLWAGDRSVEEEPRLAADLRHHVSRGAAILTVVSETPGVHWSCARILLTQSCAPILALECSLPPPE